MKFNIYLIFIIVLNNFAFSQNAEIYYKKRLLSPRKSTNTLVIEALKLLDKQEFKLSFNSKSALYLKVSMMNLEKTSPVVESFANSFAGFRGEAYFDRMKKKLS